MTDSMAAIEARAEALVKNDENMLRKLIALREKHRISQKEVAIRMGVTQPTVSNFERYDSNPRLSTIRRYALAVDAIIEHDVIDDCVDQSASAFHSAVLQWSSPAAPALLSGDLYGAWVTISKSERAPSDAAV